MKQHFTYAHSSNKKKEEGRKGKKKEKMQHDFVLRSATASSRWRCCCSLNQMYLAVATDVNPRPSTKWMVCASANELRGLQWIDGRGTVTDGVNVVSLLSSSVSSLNHEAVLR